MKTVHPTVKKKKNSSPSAGIAKMPKCFCKCFKAYSNKPFNESEFTFQGKCLPLDHVHRLLLFQRQILRACIEDNNLLNKSTPV